ncbi:IS110 family transposase [Novosphingobium umbonatum]|uniref:IS110 family transposase n=1 Tax=Novosphingobium umbonatum TaxID=1908524 RepID=A0A437MWU5_9SPHN|nr:IS110 family transposase [Novosphingobium umbonatum]RVU02144.1 IS110 family transposase [Novosphingobium umbonatum]
MQLLAVDLGKQSFHIHGITGDGEIISRKLSRAKFLDAVKRLNPAVVAMEACASAHHWGRALEAHGCTIRLIHPRFVKPFVKGAKNDAVDAEAIYEAASRPTMRFVPVKTLAQQDLQMLHRMRDRVVCERTALINHIRGLLGEYGVVLSAGAFRFRKQIIDTVASAPLSELASDLFSALISKFRALDERVADLDRKLVAICRDNERCRRLATLPGVGPVIATALVAAVDDGRHFSSGRAMAAWVGLVPRQYTTGGKPRLGGIGKKASHYLRRQLIHGARAVLLTISRRNDRLAKWAQELLTRAGHNKTAVAMANKTVRMAWAMLRTEKDFQMA